MKKTIFPLIMAMILLLTTSCGRSDDLPSPEPADGAVVMSFDADDTPNVPDENPGFYEVKNTVDAETVDERPLVGDVDEVIEVINGIPTKLKVKCFDTVIAFPASESAPNEGKRIVYCKAALEDAIENERMFPYSFGLNFDLKIELDFGENLPDSVYWCEYNLDKKGRAGSTEPRPRHYIDNIEPETVVRIGANIMFWASSSRRPADEYRTIRFVCDYSGELVEYYVFFNCYSTMQFPSEN